MTAIGAMVAKAAVTKATVTKVTAASGTRSADHARSAENAAGREGAVNAEDTESDSAVLKVVRGEPSAEELAALVAVIASRAADAAAVGEPVAAPKVSGWTDRSRYMRSPGRPFPGGWRSSTLPR